MIVDFKPEHLLTIKYQPWQAGYAQTIEHAEAVAMGYSAYTALWQGQPVICSGLVEIWPGRAMAWAAFDYRAQPCMLAAYRRMRAELDACPYTRVEMYVRPGHVAGWHWAEKLGFSLESCMKKGAPDGKDLLVMTRFKRGRAVREFLKCNSRSLQASQCQP